MPRIKYDKPKNFKKAINNLLNYVLKYKISLLMVLCFSVLSTVFAIFSPKIMGNATQEIFNGVLNKINGTGGMDFSRIKIILLILLVMFVASSIFSFIQNFVMSKISHKVTYHLRKEISHKITKLPMSYFDKSDVGDNLSLIVNDVDTIEASLNQSASRIFGAIIMLIGIFVMMMTIDVKLSLLVLLLLPVSAFLGTLLVKKSQKYFKNKQDSLGDVDSNIEEMFSNHQVIKVFNAENEMLDKFEKNNKKLARASWKSGFFGGLMHPITNFIGNLTYVVIAILGGYNIIQGRMNIGSLQSFIQYSKNFTEPIGEISQVFSMLQAMTAASERVFNFLSLEEEIDEGKEKVNLKKLKTNIEFKNIKFGYDKDKIVLHDFSAKTYEGQKIAIVGATGAGKTTLVKLLLRFYELTDGQILIDNVDIKKYSKASLRSIFGMVLQDTWLYNASIIDNIRYGNESSSDEDCIKAAVMANADHFIRSLPDGYNTIINEETSNLSGGEKQLLCIARAILANNKIMILDEATSNVDTRTEILIQEAMDKLLENKTSFVIAHRLSTIKNADLVLVLDNGNIVETGTHDTLLKKNGHYAKMYNSQFDKV